MRLVLSILMDQNPPVEKCTREPEEVIRDWIEDVESGRPSKYQWARLRYLFNHLANAPHLSPRCIRILKMIEPTMAKYGLGMTKGVDVQATYPYERVEEYK
jgi:hypothetical protein